jgi:hypothetical protein
MLPNTEEHSSLQENVVLNVVKGDGEREERIVVLKRMLARNMEPRALNLANCPIPQRKRPTDPQLEGAGPFDSLVKTSS